MVAGILMGVVLGGYALKEIARDNGVREKLKQWSAEAEKKAKKYSNNQ